MTEMSADDLVNRTLDGFKIIALLGRGGMARVYQGIDTNLGRYVAIKVIDTPHLGEAEYIKRFRREAQVIAQLNHPQVVQIYHYGEADGYLYIAMQYIQGADLEYILSDYRKDGEFIETDEAIRVIRDISSALDYIHSKGVIHRDVKPSNILLTREGRAILSDFGLALLTDVGTLGEIFGSPEYISPEQAISSANAGPISDQYSLGVIAYEMFAGRLPFKSSEALDLAMQHVTESPPSLRELRPEITPRVEASILKALSKKPEERYPSCAAFTEALSEAAKTMGEGKASTPPTLTHITIPEKVKLHREAHPVPPIPKPRRGAALQKPVEPKKSEPPDPVRARQIGQIAWAAGLLAVLLLCLCSGGYLLARSFMQSVSTAGPQPAQSSPLHYLNRDPLEKGALLAQNPTPTIRPQAPTPEPGGTQALIVILKDGEKSLFLLNRGPGDLSLLPVKLGNPPRQLSGEEWGLAALKPGECVSVWSNDKDARDYKMPDDYQCELVGEKIERRGKTRFWTSEFYIYYAGEYVGKCAPNQRDCEFQIGIES